MNMNICAGYFCGGDLEPGTFHCGGWEKSCPALRESDPADRVTTEEGTYGSDETSDHSEPMQ